MKNIILISKFTFIEVYRSKVMASIFFLILGLLMITYVTSEFAYGAPAKIALDYGFGITSISNIIMAIFIGANIVNKEIEQRTLYMILSRTISRDEFIIGKILGLSTILILNSFFLTGISVLIFVYLGGNYQSLFVWAGIFSFLEAFILLLFAVFYSLLTTATMSIIYSIGTYVVGHALNETSKIFFTKTNMYFKSMIGFSFFFVPNLYRLNLKDFLIYKQTIENSYLLGTFCYAFFYISAMMIFITYIFKNKNLD